MGQLCPCFHYCYVIHRTWSKPASLHKKTKLRCCLLADFLFLLTILTILLITQLVKENQSSKFSTRPLKPFKSTHTSCLSPPGKNASTERMGVIALDFPRASSLQLLGVKLTISIATSARSFSPSSSLLLVSSLSADAELTF